MSLLQTIFSGGFNDLMLVALIITVIMVLLILANVFADILIPNFLVGLSILATIIAWLAVFIGNTLISLTDNPTVFAIVISIALLVLVIIVTSPLVRRKKSALGQVSQVTTNVGKATTRVTKQARKRLVR